MAMGGCRYAAARNPTFSMQKIGGRPPAIPRAVVELDASPWRQWFGPIGQGQGRRSFRGSRVLVLDRPRHSEIIQGVRSTGAGGPASSTDGDMFAGCHPTAADPDNTGVDMYIGTGRPRPRKACWRRQRCAASAAQMQIRLILDTEEKRERARKMGVADPARDLRPSRTW